MPSREELLDILNPIADNRFYIPQLIEQIQGDLSVIPFVGAGMSVPFHLPAWGPFLKSLAPDPEARTVVQELLTAGRYEEAADYLYEIRGANSFQNVFAETFSRKAIEAVEVSAAVRFLAHFPGGPVVTTNFDAVLETVFEKEGARFAEVVTSSQQDRLARVVELNLDALIKLHGDGSDRADRILTFTDYERGYASGPVRTLLENLSSRTLLFLGCSLTTDRPVKVLTALAAEGRQLARHFAVVEKPEGDVETRARLKQLNDIKIRPIFFPTKGHELIEPLLELLASKTPVYHRRRGAGGRRPIYHNYPDPLGDMLGRDAAVDALRRDLSQFRVVAVEGPRGIGKTTLILHTLHTLKESDAFGALVWTTASVVKGAFGVTDIVEAISLTLDFPFSPQTTAEEKEAITLAELERKEIHCLITVDNYENITNRAVDEFLTKRLPPNCTVLLTSATVVPFQLPSMKVTPLDELPPKDALDLFLRRAGEQGVDRDLPHNLDGVHAITGGNPLAVEWVVGQMRAGQPIGTVLAIHEGSPAILDELVQSSWSLLEENARAVLCAIAIFPTPPAQEVLEAVCELSPGDCTDAIQQLRRRYMVKIVNFDSAVTAADPQSRFVLHPITREFAERQTGRATGEHFYRRAAAYFIEFVKQRGGTPELEEKQDSRALNQERANILAVLERCRAAGDDALIVSLTYYLSRWLFIEGHWSNLETWAGYAIQSAVRIGDRHSAGRLSAELGRVLSHRSQFGKAEEAFAQSLARASAEPRDVRTLGYLKHHMAEARIRKGRFEEARALLEESKSYFEEIHSRRDTIGAAYRLAVLALDTGHLDEARARLERGIEDTIDEKWERLEGLHRRFLGELELRSQPPDYEKARYQLGRAARLISETDTRTHALIEWSLAKVERGLGNSPQAAILARAARDHFEKLSMRKEWEEADILLHQIG